jgi:hypothetical protein
MIIHHEDYNISVNLSTHWASDATERWYRPNHHPQPRVRAHSLH